MCHLCRKVQTLGGLDYKATKPIFLAVAKLHKNIAPHLGDLWLLRHGRTAKLRKMLSSLYKVVPASALEGIIAVVDKEMEHIKRQMSEHPPSHSTGRWEDLQGSITPSESASGQMRKRKKLEGKKGSRNDEEKVCVSGQCLHLRTPVACQRGHFRSCTDLAQPVPSYP